MQSPRSKQLGYPGQVNYIPPIKTIPSSIPLKQPQPDFTHTERIVQKKQQYQYRPQSMSKPQNTTTPTSNRLGLGGGGAGSASSHNNMSTFNPRSEDLVIQLQNEKMSYEQETQQLRKENIQLREQLQFGGKKVFPSQPSSSQQFNATTNQIGQTQNEVFKLQQEEINRLKWQNEQLQMQQGNHPSGAARIMSQQSSSQQQHSQHSQNSLQHQQQLQQQQQQQQINQQRNQQAIDYNEWQSKFLSLEAKMRRESDQLLTEKDQQMRRETEAILQEKLAFEMENIQLRQQITDLQRIASERNKEFQDKIASLQSQFEKTIKQLSKENQSLLSGNDQLKQGNNEMQGQQQQMRQALEVQVRESQDWKAKFMEAAEIASTQVDIQQYQIVKAQLDDACADANNAKNQNYEYSREMQQMGNELELRDKEIRMLQDSLQGYEHFKQFSQQESLRAATELQAKQYLIDQQLAQLQQKEQIIEQIQERLNRVESELEAEHKKAAAKENEARRSSNKDLDYISSRYKQLETDSGKRIIDLSQEVAKLQGQLKLNRKEHEQQVATLVKEIEKLGKAFKKQAEELQKYQQLQAAQQQQYMGQTVTIEKQMREIELLKNQVQDKEIRIIQQHGQIESNNNKHKNELDTLQHGLTTEKMLRKEQETNYNNEITNLKDTLQQHKSDMQVQQMQHTILQAQMKDAELQLQQVKSDNYELRQKNEDLQQHHNIQLYDWKTVQNQLENRINELENKIQLVLNDLEKSNGLLEMKAQESDEQRQIINTVQQRHSDLNVGFSQAKGDAARLQQILQKTEQELGHARQLIMMEKENVERLRQDYNTKDKDLAEEVQIRKQLEAQVMKGTQELEKLAEAHLQRGNEKTKLTKDLDISNHKQAQLQKDLQQLSQMVEQKAHQCNQLEQMLHEVQTDFAQRQDQYQNQLQCAHEEIAQLAQRGGQKDEENMLLMQDLERSHAEMEDAKRRMHVFGEEQVRMAELSQRLNVELQQSRQQHEAHQDEHKKQMEEVKKEMKGHQAQVDELKSTNFQQELKLQESQYANQNLQSSLDEHKERLDLNQQETQRIILESQQVQHQDRHSHGQRHNELEVKVQQLETALGRSQQHAKHLESELQHITATNLELSHRIQQEQEQQRNALVAKAYKTLQTQTAYRSPSQLQLQQQQQQQQYSSPSEVFQYKSPSPSGNRSDSREKRQLPDKVVTQGSDSSNVMQLDNNNSKELQQMLQTTIHLKEENEQLKGQLQMSVQQVFDNINAEVHTQAVRNRLSRHLNGSPLNNNTRGITAYDTPSLQTAPQRLSHQIVQILEDYEMECEDLRSKLERTGQVAESFKQLSVSANTFGQGSNIGQSQNQFQASQMLQQSAMPSQRLQQSNLGGSFNNASSNAPDMMKLSASPQPRQGTLSSYSPGGGRLSQQPQQQQVFTQSFSPGGGGGASRSQRLRTSQAMASQLQGSAPNMNIGGSMLNAMGMPDSIASMVQPQTQDAYMMTQKHVDLELQAQKERLVAYHAGQDVQELEQLINTLRSEKTTLRKNNLHLLQQVHSKEAQLKHFSEELAQKHLQLQMEVKDMRNELKSVQEKYNMQKLHFEKETEAQNNKLNQLTKENQLLQLEEQRKGDVLQKNHELQSMINNMNSKYKAQIEGLKSKFEAQIKETIDRSISGEVFNRMERERIQLEGRIHELERFIATQEEHYERLSQELKGKCEAYYQSQTETRVNDLQRQYNQEKRSLQTEIVALQNENAQILQDNSQLHRLEQTLEQERQKFGDQMKQQMREYKALQQQKMDSEQGSQMEMEAERTMYQTSIHQLKSNLLDVDRQLKEGQDSAGMLRGFNEELQQQNQQQAQRISEQDTEIGRLVQDKKTLKLEILQTKEQLIQCDNQKENLKNQILSCESTIQSHIQTIDLYKKILEEQKMDSSQFNKQQALHSEFTGQQVQDKLKMMSIHLGEISKQRDSYKEQAEHNSGELAHLNNKLNSKILELEQAKNQYQAQISQVQRMESQLTEKLKKKDY